jgi:hypothetical protein
MMSFLPDLSGRLEGETIVKASLKSTLWRFCTQPVTSTSPRLSAPGYGRSRRPTLLLECPCEIWIRQIGGLRDSDDVNFGVCSGRTPMNSQVRCDEYIILETDIFVLTWARW